MRLYAFIGLTFISVTVMAQTANYETIVNSMKSLIREHYVINEKVGILCDSIDGKSYRGLKPQDFVDQVNIKLQRFSKDKHLRVEYNPQHARKANAGGDVREDQRSNERKTNFGFARIEILDGNIGMLRLSYFADPEDLEELIKSSFIFLQNTDHLIIDVRGNSGGSGAMLQRLMSVFIHEPSASVLQIRYKKNTVQLKTDSKPLATYHKPLYLLCDRNTFSAGEGFAMILQNRKKATVIGETTAGAGNIAGPYVIDDDFIITIPVGIIADILTGKGWEGAGVVPDVEAKSEDALAKTLEVIRQNSLTGIQVPRHQKYLGQSLPGSTPAVFAQGLISTPDITEFGSVFSKDGTEFFYASEPGGVAQIRYKKLVKGSWTDTKTIISHEIYSYNDPFLSPDEKRLYFISNQPLSGRGEKKDYDIWYCVREANGWSAPINAGSKINSEANEYYMSFTKTGTMYFSSNRASTGGKKDNYDIYSSKYVNGAFQTAIKLPDAINSPHYEADVFVDANESYLIFCANRPGGYGGGDLYISFKNADGDWQPAKNLGKEINADRYDFCPFVTADGNYFFYTKGADIYWVDAKVLESFR